MDISDIILSATEMDKQKLEDIPVPPLPSTGLPPGPPPRLPQGNF